MESLGLSFPFLSLKQAGPWPHTPLLPTKPHIWIQKLEEEGEGWTQGLSPDAVFCPSFPSVRCTHFFSFDNFHTQVWAPSGFHPSLCPWRSNFLIIFTSFKATCSEAFSMLWTVNSLLWTCSVHHRTFHNISGLYPLDANSTSPHQVVTTKLSPVESLWSRS